jgi:sugar O-acyltransferase (sialic acid O-acetyltransferase NeuD family)
VDLYAVVGAGGFGREVMPVASEMLVALKALNYELVFVVEGLKTDTLVNGHRAISKETFLSYSDGDRYFNIAIAAYDTRKRIALELIEQGCKPFRIAAFHSVVLANNQIAEGAIICPFAAITSNVRIGRFFHANIYSYVAHDCVIGDFVTLAPKVSCNGRVMIEDFAYIGTGAVIKQGSDDKPIVIGKGAVVGMGAVVTKSVSPHTVVVGNPAEPLEKRP